MFSDDRNIGAVRRHSTDLAVREIVRSRSTPPTNLEAAITATHVFGDDTYAEGDGESSSVAGQRSDEANLRNRRVTTATARGAGAGPKPPVLFTKASS